MHLLRRRASWLGKLDFNDSEVAMTPSMLSPLVRTANSLRRALLLLTALLAFACVQALAQEATIVGTVTDPSGAAVPNVSIAVTNNDTGVIRTVVSNGDGQY